jgi:DNA-binding MarR family transcriptional regulator
MSQTDPFLTALRAWMEAAMHRSFHAFIRHTRQSDLSLSQVNTLFYLHHRGPGSVNDLAEHLGVTKAAVSQLLDPLIASGLAQRSENPADRRSKLIALTEKGQTQVKKSRDTRHAWLSELAQVLSEAEKAQLLPAIQLLNQKTRSLAPEHHRDCQPDAKE